jgi:hypothetical protein
MGQKVVFDYLMLSPKVPTTLLTTNKYPMGHHSHPFVRKNGKNGWKQVFYDTYLHNSYSTHNSVIWANEWYSIILGYHPRCLLHSWPHIVTLESTIATHLWEKRAKNGWKQVFDDTYVYNLLFHTLICSIGQKAVFNYPMVSPKVPFTLLTPYSYPMCNHSNSFVSENGRKWLIAGFWWYLPP